MRIAKSNIINLLNKNNLVFRINIPVQKDINYDYFSTILNTISENLDLQRYRNLSFLPIITLEGYSSVISFENNHVILFDLYHASLIKQILFSFCSIQTKEFKKNQDLLKEILSSFLFSQGADVIALAFKDQQITSMHSDEQLNLDSKRLTHEDFLEINKMLAIDIDNPAIDIPIDMFLNKVDCFIIYHELFHYLIQEDKSKYNYYIELATIYFENLTQSYYNEEALEGLKKGDELIITTEGQIFNFQEWIENREKVFFHAQSIIEEIACDIFALEKTIESSLKLSGNQSKKSELVASIWVSRMFWLVELLSNLSTRIIKKKFGKEYDFGKMPEPLRIRYHIVFKHINLLFDSMLTLPENSPEEMLKFLIDTKIIIPTISMANLSSAEMYKKISEKEVIVKYLSELDMMRFNEKINYFMPNNIQNFLMNYFKNN